MLYSALRVGAMPTAAPGVRLASAMAMESREAWERGTVYRPCSASPLRSRRRGAPLPFFSAARQQDHLRLYEVAAAFPRGTLKYGVFLLFLRRLTNGSVALDLLFYTNVKRVLAQ